MHYQFAQAGNYEEYASGHVFYSAPGQVAFPVRLASEIFQRCLAHWHDSGGHGRCTLYDPCCGGAYHLAVLAFLHWEHIGKIIGADVAENALQLARRNLALLTQAGLKKRQQEIENAYQSFNKPSHAKALASSKQFVQQLSDLMQTAPLQTEVFLANALDPTAVQTSLAGQQVDIVFSDIPYGRGTSWHLDASEEAQHAPEWQLLQSLRPNLPATAVVAIAANKQAKIKHEAYRRLERFQVGKRRLTLLQPL